MCVLVYLSLMKDLRFRSAMLTPPFTAAPGTVYLFALFSFKSMILSPSSFQAAAVFKKHRFFLFLYACSEHVIVGLYKGLLMWRWRVERGKKVLRLCCIA